MLTKEEASRYAELNSQTSLNIPEQAVVAGSGDERGAQRGYYEGKKVVVVGGRVGELPQSDHLKYEWTREAMHELPGRDRVRNVPGTHEMMGDEGPREMMGAVEGPRRI